MDSTGLKNGASKQSQSSSVRSNARTASKMRYLETEPHNFREPFLQRTEMLHSAWTPQEARKKTLNEQLYLERRALVHHWFDMWTTEQRLRFIKQFMTKCMKSELQYIESWFIDAVPLARVDMTRVLPRHLSMKILGYLDPRSLCRCSQVSWHWRFLAEQDILWRSKCERNGWYLPYTPSDNEIAAYKRYYVACWYSLDNTTIERDRRAWASGDKDKASQLYGTLGAGTSALQKNDQELADQFRMVPSGPNTNASVAASLEGRISSRALQIADLLEVADENQPDRLKAKPAWKVPDNRPHDLELGFRALCTADADTLVEWRARSMGRSTTALFERLREAKRKRFVRSMQNVRASLKQTGSVSAREEKQRTLTGYGLAEMLREATASDFEAIDKSDLFNLEEYRYTELIDAPARTLSITPRPDDDLTHKPALTTSATLWQTTHSARASAASLWSSGPGAAAIQLAAVPTGSTVLLPEIPKDAEIDHRLLLISTKLPAYELLLYALKNRPKPNFVPDWSLTQLIAADGVITPYCFLSKQENVNPLAKPRFEQLDVIVYDYFATDFTTLISRIEQYFGIHEEDSIRERQTSVTMRKASRRARSVGLMCTWRTVHLEGSTPGLIDPNRAEHVVEILPSLQLCSASADHPDCMRLFNTLSLILEGEKNTSERVPNSSRPEGDRVSFSDAQPSLNAPPSRFDLFTPIAAFTDGLKLLEHLHHVFRIRITSPMSVNIDQSVYSYLRHDWIELDARNSSTSLVEPVYADYFHPDLFLFWMRTAALLDDISKRIRTEFNWHIETLNRSLCDRMIGETLFGMLTVNRVSSVLQPITDALSQLGSSNRQLRANQTPLDFVIEQLRRLSNSTLRKRNVAITTRIGTELSPTKQKRSHKTTIDEEAVPESARSDTSQRSNSISGGVILEAVTDFDDLTSSQRPPAHKTVEFADDHITLSSFAVLEKRKVIATQILHTEKRLAALLSCIDSEIRAPLRAMMNGNRAILGAHTLDTLFSDLLFFANLSKQFVEHLQARIDEWTPATAATIQVGPVYLQTIGTQMKLFANYIQNYPTILATLDRMTETNSLFHAFLKKRELTIGLNMMKLHEFYLLPLTRLYEHEKLLMYLIQHTPEDYLDMQTLKRALEKIRDLLKFMSEHKGAQSLDIDDKLKEVEKQIKGCPPLSVITDKSMRGRLKRFFVARFDLVRLRLPAVLTGDYEGQPVVAPEYRIYQYVDDATLFVFNDCAIMTHRHYVREPYDKLQKCVHDFEAQIKLTEVELIDILDTKYVQNALVVVARESGKEWICQFQFLEEKFRFVNQFDKTRRLLIKFQNAASFIDPVL